nr:hypothetical protein [uncultured Prevotella sp.]
MVNISNLTKKWMWSRWTVSKFIAELNTMGVVCVKKVGTEKFISVKPSVIQWVGLPTERGSKSHRRFFAASDRLLTIFFI